MRPIEIKRQAERVGRRSAIIYMDPYRKMIKSARKSIDSYLGTGSPTVRDEEDNEQRPCTAFKAVHNIYSTEDGLAMQQLKLVTTRAEKPVSHRHIRDMKSYERVYAERQLKSASPKKPVVASHEISSPSRLSTAGPSPMPRGSPERMESIRSYRSSMLHGLIDVCTQASEPGAALSSSPPKYRRRRSHVSFTAKRVQQLDAPSDLLESLYSLRKESDLNMHRDAVRMKLDEVTNADPAAGQIRLMIARNAVHRRNSRLPM
jgi:hypothetical protein